MNSHSPDVDSGFDGPAKVRDWMSEKPTSLGPNESIGFAMELMLWASVRHLPVVDNGQLLGIVSDRDLLAPRVASQIQQMGDRPVRECMTTDVETAHPDDDLRDASARMAAAGISALPVVEEGKLVGIITSTDILAERGRLVFKSGRGSVPSVATVMREDPIRVRPEEALTGAVIRMTREQIRHMPVVDAEDRVIGIVSDRDLRVVLGDPTRVAERGESEQDDDLTVAWAMTGNPVCVRPDESLFELASYFLDERVGAVLVTDDNGVLLGIASYLDLLEYLMGRSAPSRAD